MSLIDFAQDELDRLLKNCTDEEALKMQKMMNDGIMKIIKTFSDEGHTGFSANYALNILDRLLRFQPLSALTGEDDEWEDVSEYQNGKTLYQNKRCPAVFKDENRSYYVEAKIFSDDNGHTWYTSKDSSIDIEFPFNVPLYPENVITTDKDEWNNVQEQLLDIIENNFGLKYRELITEKTPLTDITAKENFEELENLIKEKFGKSQLNYSINDCEYFWNLINLVINGSN